MYDSSCLWFCWIQVFYLSKNREGMLKSVLKWFSQWCNKIKVIKVSKYAIQQSVNLNAICERCLPAKSFRATLKWNCLPLLRHTAKRGFSGVLLIVYLVNTSRKVFLVLKLDTWIFHSFHYDLQVINLKEYLMLASARTKQRNVGFNQRCLMSPQSWSFFSSAAQMFYRFLPREKEQLCYVCAVIMFLESWYLVGACLLSVSTSCRLNLVRAVFSFRKTSSGESFQTDDININWRADDGQSEQK